MRYKGKRRVRFADDAEVIFSDIATDAVVFINGVPYWKKTINPDISIQATGGIPRAIPKTDLTFAVIEGIKGPGPNQKLTVKKGLESAKDAFQLEVDRYGLILHEETTNTTENRLQGELILNGVTLLLAYTPTLTNIEQFFLEGKETFSVKVICYNLNENQYGIVSELELKYVSITDFDGTTNSTGAKVSFFAKEITLTLYKTTGTVVWKYKTAARKQLIKPHSHIKTPTGINKIKTQEVTFTRERDRPRIQSEPPFLHKLFIRIPSLEKEFESLKDRNGFWHGQTPEGKLDYLIRIADADREKNRQHPLIKTSYNVSDGTRYLFYFPSDVSINKTPWFPIVNQNLRFTTAIEDDETGNKIEMPLINEIHLYQFIALDKNGTLIQPMYRKEITGRVLTIAFDLTDIILKFYAKKEKNFTYDYDEKAIHKGQFELTKKSHNIWL